MYKEYTLVYTDTEVSLYDTNGFIQNFATENEAIKYIGDKGNINWYFNKRYKQYHQYDKPLSQKDRKEGGHQIQSGFICQVFNPCTGKYETGSYTYHMTITDPHGAPESIGCFDQTITHRSPVSFDSFDTFEDRLINMSDAEYERYLKINNF